MPPALWRRLCETIKVDPDRPTEALKALLSEFHVQYEHELLDLPVVRRLAEDLSHDPEAILDECYKPEGSWIECALLNDQIDENLWQWERVFPGFRNLGFTLLNFAEYGGTPMQFLEHAAEILDGTKPVTMKQVEIGTTFILGGAAGPAPRKFAFALNSDVLGGRGKHWTVVFIDLTGAQGTIEFFNSSGNPPYPPVFAWANKAIEVLTPLTSCDTITFVPVSAIRHQYGKAECGVYALYYVYQRLSGRSAESFKHTRITDETVTAFRKSHLFRPESS